MGEVCLRCLTFLQSPDPFHVDPNRPTVRRCAALAKRIAGRLGEYLPAACNATEIDVKARIDRTPIPLRLIGSSTVSRARRIDWGARAERSSLICGVNGVERGCGNLTCMVHLQATRESTSQSATMNLAVENTVFD
jgi:hypothetical protein